MWCACGGHGGWWGRLRAPASSCPPLRARVARVHLDLGNQHVFLDSQEYKTPHMPTGNLQNVRLQASGNLALSYTNSIVTGLCARRSETESDPLPRSEYLFSDDEVYALESTCGMLAGGSAQANYQTAPATPAEACAMSGTSIDEATVTCANLAVDRAAHTNCMFDFCAMGGDETAVTAGDGGSSSGGSVEGKRTRISPSGARIVCYTLLCYNFLFLFQSYHIQKR